MQWWPKLKQNSLARFGATVLIIFYILAVGAGFFAPYAPDSAQEMGSLLPPTQIFWFDNNDRFIGPHVYPTTQGPTILETGERALEIDRTQPSPLRLFVKGETYKLFGLIPGNIHLFGTLG
ncbi:ABC transporter permease, partial [Oscillatoriales cyanobacterium LEGE 11467]|nr:ABC transporter permease [Zarconia navalis LEGE 11467]